MYTREQIERARTADVVEVAGRLNLPLKRHGATWMTCCVAHEERTPSMQVGGKHNIAKCYACGAALDPIGLVQKVNGCDFREAVGYIIGEDPLQHGGRANGGRAHLSRQLPAGRSAKPTMGEAERLMGFMPEDVNAMVSVQNPLSVCLLERFAKEDVERVTGLYRLGLWHDREHYARTAFPLIDRYGRVLDVKVQRYETRVESPRFGHSVGGTFWLGRMLAGRGASGEGGARGESKEGKEGGEGGEGKVGREPVFRHDALFGEHLLERWPGRVVGLVESPKNAVVAACAFPDLVWVATGNKGMLGREVLEVLRDRNVLVFPDRDAMEEWSAKLAGMRDLANFRVSSRGQTEAEKSDIADVLMAR